MSEGGMMDVAFFVELRAWAAQARAAFEDQAEVAWHQGEQRTAEVANLAARTFAGLQTICDRQIGDERARLAAAVAAAEGRRAEAAADFGTWDRAAATAHERHHLTPDDRARIVARMQSAEEECEEAHRAVETARQALAAFDATTAGGE